MELHSITTPKTVLFTIKAVGPSNPKSTIMSSHIMGSHMDRISSLVVRVPGYRFRVRFLAPPDFLRSSGSGTGSTQPREDN
jgi:hypothetical protein